MNNLSQTKKSFKHLSLPERKLIEFHIRNGVSISSIAKMLNRNKSTISRQLSNTKNTDFVKVNKKVKRLYVASLAQHNYEINKSNCGAKLKIFKDDNLFNYLVYAIKHKHWYPQVAINRASIEGISFDISVSYHTVYNYIRKGLLKGVSMFDMPYMLSRKPTKTHTERQVKVNKVKYGTSIEQRPEFVNNRSQFGHWEGDSIVDKNNNGLFILLERLTRYALVFKLKKHDSENVNNCIRKLKKRFGKCFKHIFKTITFDNGSEFARTTQFENANLKMYFTHPYSSFEKGGVENYNGIIRRYIPKGTDISKISREKVQAINSQIINMPRKILNYYTAKELFEKHISSITA